MKRGARRRRGNKGGEAGQEEEQRKEVLLVCLTGPFSEPLGIVSQKCLPGRRNREPRIHQLLPSRRSHGIDCPLTSGLSWVGASLP